MIDVILDDIFEHMMQREEMLESLRRESLKRQSRFVSDREQREREREGIKVEGREILHC